MSDDVYWIRRLIADGFRKFKCARCGRTTYGDPVCSRCRERLKE